MYRCETDGKTVMCIMWRACHSSGRIQIEGPYKLHWKGEYCDIKWGNKQTTEEGTRYERLNQ